MAAAARVQTFHLARRDGLGGAHRLATAAAAASAALRPGPLRPRAAHPPLWEPGEPARRAPAGTNFVRAPSCLRRRAHSHSPAPPDTPTDVISCRKCAAAAALFRIQPPGLGSARRPAPLPVLAFGPSPLPLPARRRGPGEQEGWGGSGCLGSHQTRGWTAGVLPRAPASLCGSRGEHPPSPRPAFPHPVPRSPRPPAVLHFSLAPERPLCSRRPLLYLSELRAGLGEAFVDLL